MKEAAATKVGAAFFVGRKSRKVWRKNTPN
jgi:hypothetical protein